MTIPKELHVVPVDDVIEHELDAVCPCGPTPELARMSPDIYLYKHHSLDGREKKEGASGEQRA